MQFPIPNELTKLSDQFSTEGHSMWFVGGSVRDAIRGEQPKDIDLATTATPDEQISIYDRYGYRWFATGLQHGTVTVLVEGEAYEITTLRTDVETDGRHAVVEFTRDIEADLARRDFTMNAIAIGFDNEIVDPFGGVEDALAGHVRFVGDANERLREDYLRILRWFRFQARLGSVRDADALDAIKRNAEGLRQISVERIWAEISKTLSTQDASDVLSLIEDTGVAKILGISGGNIDQYRQVRRITNDPSMLLAAWLGNNAATVAKRWKTSNEERNNAEFTANRLAAVYDLNQAKLDMVDGKSRDNIIVVLMAKGDATSAEFIAQWEIPAMPVNGDDLIAKGYSTGRELGNALRNIRSAWIESDYKLDRDQLLQRTIAPS